MRNFEKGEVFPALGLICTGADEGAVALRGVPAMIAEAPLGELEALLREVLDDLAEFGASEAMDVLKNRILSTMACHNAFGPTANFRCRKWTRFCATWKNGARRSMQSRQADMDNAFHDGSRSTVYAGPLMTDQPMNMGQAAAPQAFLLLGPTASGESALALELARLLPVEIISIDSALVYRGMDIGSAKPTSVELQAAPHHLIDIRAINEPYSAADFVADASRLVREIRARGRLPLIVGGTMLYAKAIREGIDEMPSTSPEVRSAVAAEGAAKGVACDARGARQD